MENNQIEKGNLQIALFMGAIPLKRSGNNVIAAVTLKRELQQYGRVDNPTLVSSLDYHSSWDSMMEVIEAIKAKGYFVALLGGYSGRCMCRISTDATPKRVIQEIESSILLNATWIAVEKFVVWHNSNPSNPNPKYAQGGDTRVPPKVTQQTLHIQMLPSSNPNYKDDDANQLGLHKNNFLMLCKGYNKEIEATYPAQELFIVSNTPVTKPKQGAVYIPECNNENINGMLFKYLCQSPDDNELVVIESDGIQTTTTAQIFDRAKLVLASTDKKLTPDSLMPDIIKEFYAKHYNDHLGKKDITIKLPVITKDGEEFLKTLGNTILIQ